MSLSSLARALTCCKGARSYWSFADKKMNRDRKIDPFLCILWKVFQVLTRKQGEEIPSGPLYCPTSSALRCISNLVRNTNQEVISARGATCHTQPCIGQYKGLLWWTINRPAPSQIRFPLWTFLHTNDQFCVWKVDTLFTFVGFLPLLKSIILSQNLAHFEQKPRYSNRIIFHPIFWLCVHFSIEFAAN